ncbi:hypothetical protein BGZ88_003316 [Linnemannia elongata]|nr:hypothetical protein BGZ88_003316 [Linnemannia elongata]
MSLKGQHLEPLTPTSSEFLQYQGIFGTHNLFKLYKISYEPLGGHTLDWFNGFPSIFYHGTGHCGCLQRRNSTPDSGEIRAIRSDARLEESWAMVP